MNRKMGGPDIRLRWVVVRMQLIARKYIEGPRLGQSWFSQYIASASPPLSYHTCNYGILTGQCASSTSMICIHQRRMCYNYCLTATLRQSSKQIRVSITYSWIPYHIFPCISTTSTITAKRFDSKSQCSSSAYSIIVPLKLSPAVHCISWGNLTNCFKFGDNAGKKCYSVDGAVYFEGKTSQNIMYNIFYILFTRNRSIEKLCANFL